jgi:hypothetical protein
MRYGGRTLRRFELPPLGRSEPGANPSVRRPADALARSRISGYDERFTPLKIQSPVEYSSINPESRLQESTCLVTWIRLAMSQPPPQHGKDLGIIVKLSSVALGVCHRL